MLKFLKFTELKYLYLIKKLLRTLIRFILFLLFETPTVFNGILHNVQSISRNKHSFNINIWWSWLITKSKGLVDFRLFFTIGKTNRFMAILSALRKF